MENETFKKYYELVALILTALLFWAPIIVMKFDDHGAMTLDTMIVVLIFAIAIIVAAYHFTTNAILKDYKAVQKMNSSNPSSNSAADNEMQQAIKRGVRRVKTTYRSVVYFCLFGLVLLFIMLPITNLRLCTEILVANVALPFMTLAQTIIITSRLLTKKKRTRKNTIMKSSVMPGTSTSSM
jgi:hypothetical protein